MRRFWRLILCALILTCVPAYASNLPFINPTSSDLNDMMFKTFAPSKSSEYQTLTIKGDTLYIGAKDYVFGREAADITKERFSDVSWPSKDASCRTLPQSNDGQKCYNLIQVVQPLNATHVLICGTNSLAPQNKLLVRESEGDEFELSADLMIRSPLCSFDPEDSISSLMIPSAIDTATPIIFSTPRSDMQAKISIVKTLPDSLLVPNENMQEEHSDIVASFVASDAGAQKVYFVSDEKAEELSAKTYATTITQVCANDIGGKNILANQWTSLLKVRLTCQMDSSFPLVFDMVTDAVEGRDGIIYGTFTTRHETFRTNAVCSFRLFDIQNAFKKGSFLEESETGRPYKAVRPPDNTLQPGMCAYPGMLDQKPEASTSRDFPESHLTFMSEHNLVNEVLNPAYPPSPNGSLIPVSKGPLFTKSNGKFTKIAVEQVDDIAGITHDVIFVGTENGIVYKFLSIAKKTSVETIELAQYKVSNSPVISMKISQNFLYVGTREHVHQMSTVNCETYTKTCQFCDPCRMCVLARDPNCAWDGKVEKCVRIQGGKKTVLIQDITHGAVTKCGVMSFQNPESKKVNEGESVTLGNSSKNPAIKSTWYKLNKDVYTNIRVLGRNGRYKITIDSQLQISNFNAKEDSTIYKCEYEGNNELVKTRFYAVSSSSVVAPVTSTALPPSPTSVDTIKIPTDTNAATISNTVTDSGYLSTASPVSAANIAVPLVVVGVGIVLVIFVIWRCKKFHKYKTGQKDISEKLESPPVNLEEAPPSHDNSTNNNNACVADGPSSSRRDTSPLLLQEPQSDVQQYAILAQERCPEEVASAGPRQRNAQSLDYLGHGAGSDESIRFIDEMDTERYRPVEQSSSLREEGGRRRVPPARTKSMPGSALYVVLAGKKLQCSTLQRNKRGNLIIELDANQSGMSEIASVAHADEVIQILPDHDETDSHEPLEFKPAEQKEHPTVYGSKTDIQNARKAFFQHDNKPGDNSININYMTSTPVNNKAIKGGQIHKTPLTEQTSKSSLRSYGQNSSEEIDSDTTVKGSSSTLKPEDTPILAQSQSKSEPHKYHHPRPRSNLRASTKALTRHPNSGMPVAAPIATGATSHNVSNKSLDRSSGSSDGDEQLHGRDKKSKRRSRNKPPHSPSKESHTSQGSSSGSDYKSARSSMASQINDHR